jgi:hypothetical protein
VGRRRPRIFIPGSRRQSLVSGALLWTIQAFTPQVLDARSESTPLADEGLKGLEEGACTNMLVTAWVPVNQSERTSLGEPPTSDRQEIGVRGDQDAVVLCRLREDGLVVRLLSKHIDRQDNVPTAASEPAANRAVDVLVCEDPESGRHYRAELRRC